MMINRCIIALAGWLALLLVGSPLLAVEPTGTALSRRAPSLSGTVEGSIQQMTGEDVAVNGSAVISGALRLPGTPALQLNGKPDIGSNIEADGPIEPSGYQVILNGRCRIGSLISRVSPVALPAVPAPKAPLGSIDLTIDRSGQAVGSWASVRNLTLQGNAGTYAIPPGSYGRVIVNSGNGLTLGIAESNTPSVYNFQELTLNGQARVLVAGPVIVNLANGLTTNGTIGSWSNPSWLELNVSAGAVNLNGGALLAGYASAPQSEVIVGGNAELSGGVICDRLTVHGRGLLRLWQRSGGTPNQPPLATPQQIDAQEDETAVIILSGQDPDNGALTFRITRPPQHGRLQVSGAVVSYIPAINYNGPDGFSFVASDGKEESEEADVTIHVLPVNDAPVAQAQQVVLSEDGEITITLSGHDVDGDTLTFSIAEQPAQGTLEAVGSTGSVYRYTPAADFHGADAFQFTASDGVEASLPAMVKLTVLPGNDTPVAHNLALTVREDEQLGIRLTGTDVDGDPLSFKVTAQPLEGTLTTTGTVSEFLYQPRENFWGDDGFEYVAIDGSVTSEPGTVSISVLAVNDPPVAEGARFETQEDAPIVITLPARDEEGDPLAYTIEQVPANGAIEALDDGAGRFRYTPFTDFYGSDSFTFSVRDGELTSNIAAVTIVIHPVNDAAIAEAQTVHVPEDGSVRIVLTATDVDADQLEYLVVLNDPEKGPRHGVLQIAESGLPNLVYTPFPDYAGPDYFEFSVRDGSATSSPARVSIVVVPSNDPPTVELGPDLTLAQPGIGFLSAQIQDVDGTPEGEPRVLLWEMVDGPEAVILSQPGGAATSALFPAAGTYQIRFTLNDAGLVASAEMTVTVKPRNQPPVIEAGPDQVIMEGQLASVLAQATDDGLPGTQPLRFTWRMHSGPGSAAFSAPELEGAKQQVSFTQPGDYVLRVTCSDGLLSASDDLRITMQRPNRAPVVDAGVDRSGRVGEAIALTASVSDDGLPLTAALSMQWSQVSGPGTALFSDIVKSVTSVQFTEPGDYVLRVEVSDGELSTTDVVTVRVVPPSNQAPKVFAGSDQQLSGVNVATLHGSVSDDGLPADALLVQGWATVSGPGEVVFADPQAAVTEATFTVPGTYSLRLAAYDSDLAANDDVQISVTFENQAPKVNAGSDRDVEGSREVQLAGTVIDDGLPEGLALQCQWEIVEGPGMVHFTEPDAAKTRANVSMDGAYVFRFTASDTLLSGSDTVTIRFGDLNEAPMVDAGPDISSSATVATSSNLLRNPGCEQVGASNNQIPEWQVVSGANWKGGSAQITGFPAALEGERYFYAGIANNAELRQDVDVGVYADGIDARRQLFQFSVRVRAKSEAALDRALAALEFRTADGAMLDSRLFELTPMDSKWNLFADTAIVPSGTRVVRVRLMVANMLADASADAWFDDVRLEAIAAPRIVLSGVASDDGRPIGSELEITWTQLSGPALAVIEDSASISTAVFATTPGEYVFQLSATDSKRILADSMVLHIETEGGNLAPGVDAGDDFTVPTPLASAQLGGAVSDDHKATEELVYGWTKVSGPGEAMFHDSGSLSTAVRFSEAGQYILRLSVSDGEFVASDEVLIVVECPPIPVPLDVAVVVDHSLSMVGEKLASAKEAAISFVRYLDPLLDRTAVVAFSDSASLVQDLTPDQERAVAALKRIGSGSGTAIHEGLRVAREHLQTAGRVDEETRVIVLMSDGGSNLGAAILQANAAKLAGIRIITIGIGTDADHNLLRTIATSAADYNYAANNVALSDIYDSLVRMLCRGDGDPLIVNAGKDILALAADESANLEGEIRSFGVPESYAKISHWSVVAGPGIVEFQDESAAVTTARFALPGVYTLALTASLDDGAGYRYSKSDRVVVRVGVPCESAVPEGVAAYWSGDSAVESFSLSDGVGEVSYSVGRVGSALQFDGIDDGVLVRGRESLDVGRGGAFTAEFWMYSGEPNRNIFGWIKGGAYGVNCYQGFSILRFVIVGRDGSSRELTVNRPSDGHWHHIALTYDSETGVQAVYVNGVLSGTQNIGAIAPQTGEGYDLLLGGAAPGRSAFLGKIDEFTLYRRALKPEEVFAVFSAGEIGKCPVSGNAMPAVNAGRDMAVTEQPWTVNLEGAVADDGLPLGSRLSVRWRKVEGPGEVTFGDATTEETTAAFSASGIYILELGADDGESWARDLVEIRVGVPCEVPAPNGLAAWLPGNGDATELLSGISGGRIGVGFAPGKVGQAFDFNGGPGYVRNAWRESLDVGSGGAFTAEFWMYPGEPNRNIFGWIKGGAYGVNCYQGFSILRFVMVGRDGSSRELVVNRPSDRQWHHVALTYDSATGVQAVYVNGVLSGAQNIGAIMPQTGEGYDLLLGGAAPGRSAFLGKIDEFTLYRRALTNAEILQIFNAGSCGKEPLRVNSAPRVIASPDATVEVEVFGSISASVLDDGLPASGVLSLLWTQIEGPAASLIVTPDAASTSFKVPEPGRYVFKVTAFDGELSGSDTVEIVARPRPNQAPIVTAGSSVSVPINSVIRLEGAVVDDGLPLGGNQTFLWSKVAGDGEVIFAAPRATSSVATFSNAGTYVLSLSASDGELTGSALVEIQVLPAQNAAPIADAGPDIAIPFGDAASVIPSIEDDGLPNGYVLVGWKVISGTGNQTLERDPAGDAVTATFSRVGEYVLRLTVSDGEFEVHDDVTVTVTSKNRPPPAVELLAPMEGQQMVAGGVFTLLANASATVGSIESVEFYVDGVKIGERTEAPYAGPWTPVPGVHTVTAVVTDDIGVRVTSAPVHVTAELTPPGIRLVGPLNGSGFAHGRPIALSAQVLGSVDVDRVEFRVNDTTVAQVAQSPYRFDWVNAPHGEHQVRAVLFAGDGQTFESDTASIRVLDDPGVGSGLVLEIHSPGLGATLTAPTTFKGTVKSPILKSWRIEVRKKENADGKWSVFASGSNEVNAAALGELDTTILKNGIHEIRLVATDLLGRSFANDLTVLLDGDMKIGHFTAAFQDLQIPLSGIPITVTRIYDSRDRTRSGDFGYGWNLDVSAIRLERGAPLGQGWVGVTPDGNSVSLINAYSIDEDLSHAIAITMADGSVERFRVRWKLVDRVALDISDIASTYYGLPYTDPADLEGLTPEQREAYYASLWAEHQRDMEELRALLDLVNDEGTQLQAPPPAHARMQLIFEPLPGTHGTLQPKGVPQYLYRADTWGGAMELAGEPEPDLVNNPGALFKDSSGWTYTSQDGRRFEFTTQGRLEQVADLQGNTLSITPNGVFHSSGQSIIFQRGATGRIDAITDPAGNTLRYIYDAAGDLRSFYDRTKDPEVDSPSTRFSYASGTHYLTDIFDARGILAAKNFFDDSGRLFKTVDAQGEQTVFGHELGSRTETITDRTGKVTRHRYDERGNITRTESPDGTVTVSGYHRWSDGTLSNLKTSESISGLFTNDAGELVQQTFTTQYSYEDDDASSPPTNDGLLRKLVDPLGNPTKFDYDVRGNLLKVQGPGGDCCGSAGGDFTINTYYPGTNLLHTSTDALGNVTVHTYDARGNPDKETRKVTVLDASGASSMQTLITDHDYDRFGRLEKLTDAADHVTRYERDSLGNVRYERTTRTLADGANVPVVTEHAYDAEGRLTKTWDAEHSRESGADPASETAYNELGKPWKTYDALRNVTESLYNSRGELEKVIYADGASDQTLYDAEGRREYSIDRRGKATQFVYDSVGRLRETWWRGSTGDAPVRLSASVYDAAGRVVTATDARGYTTTNIYDGAGRRTATINAKSERTGFQYDSSGNLRFATDAKGRTVEHVYDALNRRTKTVFPASDVWTGTTEERTATETVTVYDELGRRTGEYEQSPVGQPLASRRLTRFIYDSVGRLEAVVDPLGQVTGYGYDEVGNQLSQTDAKGRTTEYVYDNLGRRKHRNLPGGQSETLQYDAVGNLRFRTDFNGETTEMRYDAMGRLRFRIPATRPQEEVEWRYTASGQREWMIESNGRTTQYHYDARDRLHWKATPEGTITYTHDDAGHVTSIASSTPDGASAVYTHDELGRLETVTDANQQQIGYQYDLVGNLEHVNLPNGVTSSYGYDENNRLRVLEHRSAAQVDSLLAGYQYQVHATGRRRTATDIGAVLGNAQSSRITTYTYDALWRLKSETISGDPNGRNGSVGYGYDAVGNRETRSSSIAGLGTQSFTYDANDRVGGDTYDANGNTRLGSASQVSGAVTLLEPSAPAPVVGSDEYNSQDRLISRTGGNGSVQIVYDGDGHKVRETVVRDGVANTTTYLVDELNPTGYAQVLEEKANPAADGSGGTLVRVYTYGHDLLSQDQYVGTEESGQWQLSYYGYDGHGNVRFLTSPTGQITDTYTYDAFGALLSATGGTANRYLYCGEQYDSALGLYYLRARLMTPLTGRFWTADTYEGSGSDPQSLHKYIYAEGEPVIGVDPTGYEIEFDSPKGTEAHLLFEGHAAISGIQLHHNTPIRYIFPDMWNEPSAGSAPDITAVVASPMFRDSYFELKPISHRSASWLADQDQEQMGRYDRLLKRKGFRRGESHRLVPQQTMIGYIPETLGGYEVWVEAARDVEFIQGKKYDTRGLVYYWLRPRERTLEKVGALALAGAGVRMMMAFGNQPAGHVVQASRVAVQGRLVVQQATIGRQVAVHARIGLTSISKL